MQRVLCYSFIFVLTLTSITSCSSSKFTTGATPQVAAEHIVLQQTSPGTPRGFTARYTQQFKDFALVFYTKQGRAAQQALYYQIVYRDQAEWYTNECCDGGGGSLTPVAGLKDLVQVATSTSVEPRFIYGRAMSPDVMAVEAQFDTGQTVTDQVEDNFFLVLSQTGRNICTIRVLSAQHATLAETRLSNAPGCP